MNTGERQVIDILRNHIIRAWQSAAGIEPTADEIQTLLSLVYVEVLDLDDGGTGEREIKSLLRTAVLRNPDQTDSVWFQLIALCSGFATRRAGADRAGLQKSLQETGINLNVPRGYQNDIRRLREHSGMSIDALLQHSRIQAN